MGAKNKVRCSAFARAHPGGRRRPKYHMSGVKLSPQLQKIIDDAVGPEFCEQNKGATAKVTEIELRARRQLYAYLEAVSMRMEPL